MRTRSSLLDCKSLFVRRVANERYATRGEVDSINDERLRGLRKELKAYKSLDIPGTHSEGYRIPMEAAIKKLNTHTKFPQSIEICEGALVMLIKVS
jgi:hypothetical protein